MEKERRRTVQLLRRQPDRIKKRQFPQRFRNAGERHEDETQLETGVGNDGAGWHVFRGGAFGIQPDFGGHSDWSPAATASLCGSSGLPRARGGIYVDRRLLVSGARTLCVARRILDASSV